MRLCEHVAFTVADPDEARRYNDIDLDLLAPIAVAVIAIVEALADLYHLQTLGLLELKYRWLDADLEAQLRSRTGDAQNLATEVVAGRHTRNIEHEIGYEAVCLVHVVLV